MGSVRAGVPDWSDYAALQEALMNLMGVCRLIIQGEPEFASASSEPKQ